MIRTIVQLPLQGYAWLASRTHPGLRAASLVAAFLLGLPAGATAQWEQSDGQQFGQGKRYWGTMLSDMASTLCPAYRAIRYVIMVVAGIMFIWYIFRGAQGNRKAWGLAIVMALVGTFMMSPNYWLSTFGFANAQVTLNWNQCIGGGYGNYR